MKPMTQPQLFESTVVRRAMPQALGIGQGAIHIE